MVRLFSITFHKNILKFIRSMDKNCIFIYLLCMFKLKIYRLKSKLVYSISPFSKIPYAIMLAIVIWGLATGEAGWTAFPIIIGLICLIGTLYAEAWTFDSEKQEIVSYFGVFPIMKRNRYSYNDVDSLRIKHFIRGISADDEKRLASEMADHAADSKKRKHGQKPMMIFSLCLAGTDKNVPIEVIEENKSSGRTESDAVVIASYTGLHLEVDRPRDSGPRMSIRDIPKGFNKR